MTKNDEIQKRILDVLGAAGQRSARVLAVVEYGSGQRDLDLFIVTETGPFASVRLGRIDAFLVSLHEASLRLRWRDIAFTEPILTRRVVFDSDSTLARLDQELARERVSIPLVSSYLRQRSYVELYNSRLYLSWIRVALRLRRLRSGQPDTLSPFLGAQDLFHNLGDKCEDFIVSLGYALSYFYTHQHHKKHGHEAVLYAELTRQYPLLAALHEAIGCAGADELDTYVGFYRRVARMIAGDYEPHQLPE